MRGSAVELEIGAVEGTLMGAAGPASGRESEPWSPGHHLHTKSIGSQFLMPLDRSPASTIRRNGCTNKSIGNVIALSPNSCRVTRFFSLRLALFRDHCPSESYHCPVMSIDAGPHGKKVGGRQYKLSTLYGTKLPGESACYVIHLDAVEASTVGLDGEFGPGHPKRR